MVIFAAILVLIRLQTQQMAGLVEFTAPPLDEIRAFLPAAAGLAGPQDGVWTVEDAAGQKLGATLQTSPQSDHILGFSGPTNVLLVLDPDNRVLGLRFLGSGDTREHLRQVARNEAFMCALDRLSLPEIAQAPVDAVTGATLTSMAIIESLRNRLDQSRRSRSLRFPEPPTMQVVTQLFDRAHDVIPDPTFDGLWRVHDDQGAKLGFLLRTSPAADNTIGYQGPTDALLSLDTEQHVRGLAIDRSFDNEPYVGYIREDTYFPTHFTNQTISDLAALDLTTGEIEGVSGATMTSRAVAAGIAAAAQAHVDQEQAALAKSPPASDLPIHDIGTIGMVLLAALVGLTPLRGNKIARTCLRFGVIGYLGLMAGNLLSIAMLVGWAKHGVPWQSALGLVVMSVAAMAVPLTTKRNLYCSHLCPHGALQQLLSNRVPYRLRVRGRLRVALSLLPAGLLVWSVLVAMTAIGFSLVDIEPFDAYLFPIAGWATIMVAVVGITASLLVPMAYCRFGCPTGRLLEYLRFHGRSDRWSIRDWGAVICLGLAVWLYVAR